MRLRKNIQYWISQSTHTSQHCNPPQHSITSLFARLAPLAPSCNHTASHPLSILQSPHAALNQVRVLEAFSFEERTVLPLSIFPRKSLLDPHPHSPWSDMLTSSAASTYSRHTLQYSYSDGRLLAGCCGRALDTLRSLDEQYCATVLVAMQERSSRIQRFRFGNGTDDGDA